MQGLLFNSQPILRSFYSIICPSLTRSGRRRASILFHTHPNLNSTFSRTLSICTVPLHANQSIIKGRYHATKVVVASRDLVARVKKQSKTASLVAEKAVKEMKENIFTVPNLLCVMRIGLTPYIGYLIVQEDFRLACCITALAALTDLLDGAIARSFASQRSMAGSYLDPLADKILVTTLCLTLTYVGLIPVPLTALIVLRDILLISAACFVRFRSIPPPVTLRKYFDVTYATANLSPTKISKYNTAIQLAMVVTSLGAPVLGYVDHHALQFLWLATAVSTVASGLSYVFQKGTYKYFLRPQKDRRKS